MSPSATELQTQPPISSQRPLDSAVLAYKAADVPADVLFEKRLPGHELKAEPVVDHGRAPADKAGNASEAPTDMLAGICRQVGAAAPSCHLVADTLNLPSFKSRQGVDRNANVRAPGQRQ